MKKVSKTYKKHSGDKKLLRFVGLINTDSKAQRIWIGTMTPTPKLRGQTAHSHKGVRTPPPPPTSPNHQPICFKEMGPTKSMGIRLPVYVYCVGLDTGISDGSFVPYVRGLEIQS
jgi:hypothetical protein